MGIVGAFAVPHPPLIVPAVGRGDERIIADTVDAFQQVTQRILALRPDVLVITSPHAPLYFESFYIQEAPALQGSMAQFRAPQCQVSAQVDTEFAEAWARASVAAGLPICYGGKGDTELDHATFIPLFFLQEQLAADAACEGSASPNVDSAAAAPGVFPGAELALPLVVRAGISFRSFDDHRLFGQCLRQVADASGKRVVLIASGDCSHKLREEGPYGYVEEGPVFDAELCDIFRENRLEDLFNFDPAFTDAAAECGLRSFQIAVGALQEDQLEPELLSYEGPFGVGYLTADFGCTSSEPSSQPCVTEYAAASLQDSSEAPQSQQADFGCTSSAASSAPAVDPYVKLARATVEHFTRTGKELTIPDDTPNELLIRRAGAFVSLHMRGMLRGCIGTIGPVQDNLALEVIANGISACSRDPRFEPVEEADLDYLSYSVDVLGDIEFLGVESDLRAKDQLNSKLDHIRYGVIVEKRWKRGLLLPNLDGVDTWEEQLEIAKMKAGIDPADQDVELSRFEVVRHDVGGEARIAR